MKTYYFPICDDCKVWKYYMPVEMTDDQGSELERFMKAYKIAPNDEENEEITPFSKEEDTLFSKCEYEEAKEIAPFSDCEYLKDIQRLVWKAVIEDIAHSIRPSVLRLYGDEGCSLEVCANAYLDSEGAMILWPVKESPY